MMVQAQAYRNSILIGPKITIPGAWHPKKALRLPVVSQ